MNEPAPILDNDLRALLQLDDHPDVALDYSDYSGPDYSGPGTAASSSELVERYHELKRSAQTLPEYQPTRDLVSAALEQTESPKPSFEKKGLPLELMVCAAAAILIIGLVFWRPTPPSNGQPDTAAEATASPRRSATPEATFFFSQEKNRTSQRIRSTRQRIHTRQSHLENTRYFSTHQQS